jgi:hypothetical protein
VHGNTIRSVGLNAPELGGDTHCWSERMPAARAMWCLRQIIRTGDDIDLLLMDCSCRPGIEASQPSRTTAILAALHNTAEAVPRSF